MLELVIVIYTNYLKTGRGCNNGGCNCIIGYHQRFVFYILELDYGNLIGGFQKWNIIIIILLKSSRLYLVLQSILEDVLVIDLVLYC